MIHLRRTVGIFCLLCVLAVCAAVGLLFIMNMGEEPVVVPASSYDQLEISISFPSGEQRIRVWENNGGVFYFFLPAGSDSYEIKFCNLGTGSLLRLDSESYTTDSSVIKNIHYSETYEMELTVTGEIQPLETAQVIFLKSEEIPSLFIDTASGSMETIHADKEVKETAHVSLFGSDGSREYSGELEYIKARGNSSFRMEKKSYQIRFPKNNALLGMPAAEKWILLADMIDDTLIKNEIVYRFAENYTSVPSIEGRFVDLYLNGEYVGNYYLCEKVEVSENRLNISDLEKRTEQINSERSYENAALYVSEDGRIKAAEGLENPSDITGGYLVEHIPDNIYAEATNAFMTDSGHCYEIVSPNPATVEQAEYISNQFNEMETALQQEDGIHPETGLHFSEYLDVDSWVSKYLMEELFHDPDAAYASMFFYKDSDNVDSHIYSGPMWDYDRAMGSYGMKSYQWDDPDQVGYYGIYVQEMLKHQEVRKQVYDTFSQCFLPYVKYQASADIYQISSTIECSARLDQVRWPQVHGYYSETEAGRDYLISFLEQKANYLKEVWLEEEEYCTVTFLDYYGNVYERYNLKKGSFLEAAPAIAAFGAIFTGWYTVEDDIPFDSRLPILQNVTYQSGWIEMDILLLNGLAIADMDISQADPEVLRQMADRLQEMQKQAETESSGHSEREE